MEGSRGRGAAVLAAVAALAGLGTGCTSVQGTEVQRAASGFAAAEPGARCELLAPATLATLAAEESAPCPEAIEQLPLGTGEVVAAEVWGDEAQVRLADDTLSLTRTAAGWRIAAAACRPAGERPYECRLEGS